MNSFSFEKGWGQIPLSKADEVRERIMVALDIKTRSGFLYRLRGMCEPKVSEAKAIEAVFKEYGVTKVWGK